MSNDPIDHQRISELAFELWCKRGRPQGSPEVDWQRAEELLAHDSGISPALRPPRTASPSAKLDGDGFERRTSVSAAQANDVAPKIFVL